MELEKRVIHCWKLIFFVATSNIICNCFFIIKNILITANTVIFGPPHYPLTTEKIFSLIGIQYSTFPVLQENLYCYFFAFSLLGLYIYWYHELNDADDFSKSIKLPTYYFDRILARLLKLNIFIICFSVCIVDVFRISDLLTAFEGYALIGFIQTIFYILLLFRFRYIKQLHHT